MASNLLPFAPRSAASVPLVPALQAYVAATYGEDPATYANDFRRLETLRTELASPDAHESYVRTLWSYYACLLTLDAKFPISDNEIRIFFTWSTAMLDRPVQEAFTTVAFERASVLFNIASAYSRLAILENRSLAEGVKRAAKYQQLSAGVIKYILDNAPNWRIPLINDFDPSVLTCLLNLQLAQAQEGYSAKAVLDKMKPALVAKISTGAAALYDRALAAVLPSMPRFFTPFLRAKSLQFLADACYRLSIDCADNLRYGEQVAWLARGSRILKEVFDSGILQDSIFDQVSSTMQSDLNILLNIIRSRLASAQKDNDNIYMQPVPKDTDLKAPAGAMLAETMLPYGNLNLSDFASLIGDKPLFYHLVPMEIHSQVSEYYARRDDLVNSLMNEIKRTGSSYDEALRSLGLPDMLYVVEKPASIPESILANSDTVKQQGGISWIVQMLGELREARILASELISECERLLDQEASSDNLSRQAYNQRWSRPTSHQTNAPYRAGVEKYRKLLADGDIEDQTTTEKFTSNRNVIEFLCLSKEDLQNAIPKATSSSTSAQRSEMNQLHPLLKEGEECAKWRESLMKQLREFSKEDDIAKVLLPLYNEKKRYNKTDIFNSSLQKYNNYQHAITAHNEQINKLVRVIEEKSIALKSIKSSSDGLVAVEKIVNSMSAGYLAFMELSVRLQEGKIFYEKLNKALRTLLKQVEDYCAARNDEKNIFTEQLNAGLNETVSFKESSQSLPPSDSYQKLPIDQYQQPYQPLNDPPFHQLQQQPPQFVRAPVPSRPPFNRESMQYQESQQYLKQLREPQSRPRQG